MGNYEADVSVLTGQFLNCLNVCGQKLGYPFMLYSNGECGKKLVSSDGKHNAVAKVLKSSCADDSSLSSFGVVSEDKTDGMQDCEAFLKYLNNCGCDLGFPFVILKDGSVVKTPLSAQDKTTVIVKVLRAFNDGAKLGAIKVEVLSKEKNPISDSDEAFLELKAIIDDDDLERFEKLSNFNHQMIEYILTNASRKILMFFLRHCKPNSLTLEELDLLWIKNDLELLDAYYWWVRVSGK